MAPRPSYQSPQKEQDYAGEHIASSSLLLSSTAPSSSPTLVALPTLPYEARVTQVKETIEEFGQHGQGRLDVAPRPTDQPRDSWEPQQEHFPIATSNLKTLPT